VSGYAQAERQSLCDLFLAVGPGSPTLCEGWQTADLAAHLVLRERRPDAGPGILLSPFARYTARVQAQIRDRSSWEELVGTVRRGPPLPLRPADEAMNTVEYFIHHEDVRRAGPEPEPRELSTSFQQALWRRLRGMGRLLFRRSPVGVVLDAPGFGTATVSTKAPAVLVRGDPGELLLFASGRQGVARVNLEGDEDARSRLRAAPMGL
jgi:uncharacterized protein (TIGR03085 family)